MSVILSIESGPIILAFGLSFLISLVCVFGIHPATTNGELVSESFFIR